VGNIQTQNTEHSLYQYSYDRTYQLTSADNPTLQDEAYSYDRVGNRLTSLETDGLWSYNLNNELITNTQATYENDANGNTTKKTQAGQTTIYEYNARNRLSKVFLPDGRVAIYAYDPFGRRIRKQVANTATYFAYADEGLIGEYGEQGATQKTYGWKPNGLWGTDPLYMTDGGGFYCYHNDHLGTPQRLTDEFGAVVWSAGYQAFGLAMVDPVSTVENNLRFPGQYVDVESGLYYNWNRNYDPVMAKYTQIDPFGFVAGDVNLYRYVQNNPKSYFDNTGLFASINCVRCKGKNELFCLVFDDYQLQFSFRANMNNWNNAKPVNPKKDPFGTNGPLPPGEYWLTNGNSSKFGPRTPSPTNVGVPGIVKTPKGTRRDGVRFHTGKISEGCVTFGYGPVAKKQLNDIKDLIDRNTGKGGTRFTIDDRCCGGKK
jgi:RHS repeat-associated protein